MSDQVPLPQRASVSQILPVEAQEIQQSTAKGTELLGNPPTLSGGKTAGIQGSELYLKMVDGQLCPAMCLTYTAYLAISTWTKGSCGVYLVQGGGLSLSLFTTGWELQMLSWTHSCLPSQPSRPPCRPVRLPHMAAVQAAG